ncbi:MAG: substrate-binding domain-containing protein [Planctomycetota bacterium]
MEDTTNRGARGAHWALPLLLCAGCQDRLPPPPSGTLPWQLGDVVRQPARAEPARANPLPTRPPPAGADDAPAAPSGERAELGAAPVAAPRTVAFGRTARQLCGDGLLAAAGVDDALLPSIVDDRDAVELLLVGKVDFTITTTALSERDRRAGLMATPLGVEVWTLVVAADSPLYDLSRDAARRLLCGQLRDCRDLGLVPGPITLGVPRAADARERANRALLPGEPFADQATPVDGGRGAFDLLLREPRAIAIVQVAALTPDAGVRALSIDGVPPNRATFASGAYPYGAPLLVVTNGPPRGAAQTVVQAVQRGAFELPPERLTAPR